jgi:hypothetical protein
MVKGESSDNTVFGDAIRSELVEGDEATILDVNESMDHCVCQANIHHLVHNEDATMFNNDFISHGSKSTLPSEQDYEVLKPCYAWLPMETIKMTFSETTQYAHLPFNTVLWK